MFRNVAVNHLAMRKIRVVILGILLSITGQAFAQQGTLKGKLFDSVSKQALPLATITVFRAKDTSIVTYRLSDPQGNFKIPGLPSSLDLRAVITSSGYKVYRKEFSFSSSMTELDLGVIHLATDTSELDQVLVIAERPPVSIKKDTIEFNATAFKTLPSALVEDLLKKLPGVEVDPDGNMRVNGRAVNRILVDGKEFFGGDPKVATRNLPANLIDKVQVVDDKEQLTQNPDITKGELGQVINLKLKKAIKKGWFGKAYAGGGSGSKTHYELGAIVNSFRDTLQVSALAYSNNLNKSGFSLGDIEKLGGFGRSGFNSLSVWSDGGVAVNGVSFGATGQGIQRSSGGGINISHDPSKKLKLNFQYFYGTINSNYESLANTQQFYRDTTLFTRAESKQVSDDYNHNVSSNIKWTPDSMTNIIFRPNVTFRKNLVDRNMATTNSSNYEPLLNESNNQLHSTTKDVNFSQELTFDRRFRKTGRYFSFYSNMNYNTSRGDQTNNVESVFYDGQPSSDNLDQLRKRDYNNFTINGSITYNEPLSKRWFLRLSNNFDYFKSKDDLNTYDWNPSTNRYELLNADLTNGLDRSGIRNNSTVGISYRYKKLSIQPVLQATILNFSNVYLKGGTIDQHYNYFFPGININYGAFNAGYRASVNAPSAGDLRPVVDNTNPLYQTYGNPNLKPTISHNFNGGLYKFDAKRSINYSVNFNGNVEANSVIRVRSVSDKGVQITQPINVDGIWRINTSLMFSKQYKLINSLTLSLRPSFNYGFSRSVVIVNNVRSRYDSWSTSPAMNVAFNFKDLVEISQRYSVSYRENRYQSSNFRNSFVTTHFSTTELVVRMPKNWVWESSVDYRYNPQVTPGISKNIVRWHGGLNYLFLKEQKGQLRFYVYDILKQAVNSYRTVAENYIQDVQSSTLTRYFLLTFSYNIRDFKGGKVGGRQSIFFF